MFKNHSVATNNILNKMEREAKEPKKQSEALDIIEKVMNKSAYDMPLVNYTDDDYKKLSLEELSAHNPSAEPLNAQANIMLQVMKDSPDMCTCQNPYYLKDLNQISRSIFIDNFSAYLRDASYINFCNMVDQLTSIANTEDSRFVLNILPLKSTLYNIIYSDKAYAKMKSILNTYFYSDYCSGRMVTYDIAKDNKSAFTNYSYLNKYVVGLFGLEIYSMFCEAITRSVDEVFLNIYQDCNYENILRRAAKSLNLMNCPRSLMPMYVSNMTKLYLSSQLEILMGFLSDQVFYPAFDKIYAASYYSFGLTYQMYKEAMESKGLNVNGTPIKTTNIPYSYPEYDDE